MSVYDPSANDPVVSVALTGVHFLFVAFAIVDLASHGYISQGLFLMVGLTLALAEVSMLPYWTNAVTANSPPWTVAGAWGFIILNYICLLYSAFALDAYIGAERDLLGRALSRTAGKVLREERRKAEKEEEASVNLFISSRGQHKDGTSSNIAKPDEPLYQVNGSGVLSLGSGKLHDVYRETEPANSNLTLGGARLQRASEPDESHVDAIQDTLTLGGAKQSTSARQLGSDHSSSDNEDDFGYDSGRPRRGTGGLANWSARRRHRRPSGGNLSSQRSREPVAPSGFEIIARVLPRRIFDRSSQQDQMLLDETVLKMIGMGKDIAVYVQKYRRRKAIEAAGWYFISFCILMGMGALEQVANQGMVVGWFDALWIVLSDAMMLLALIPASPPISPGATPTGDGNRSTRSRLRDGGWIATIPLHSFTPPLWVLLLLLLACRAVLVTVPLYLSFASSCVCYLICTLYLMFITLQERFRTGRVLYVAVVLLFVFTLLLAIHTTFIALSTFLPVIAAFMGEARKFVWDANSPPLTEWILGLASVSFLLAVTLIYVATLLVSTHLLWLWIGVYLLLCLTGLALDCIAYGYLSIQLGIFVSVTLLLPALGCVFFSFKETISAVPPRRRLLFFIVCSFAFEIGWAFALSSLNTSIMKYFVFVVVLEFNALVCVCNCLALMYNCVFGNRCSIIVLIIAIASYLAVLPVAFGFSSSTDLASQPYLAASVISYLIIPCLLLFGVSSVRLADLGWESIFSPSTNPHLQFQKMLLRLAFLFSCLFLIGAIAVTAVSFGVISATWLGTVTVLIFFIVSTLQTRFFQKPFSPTDMGGRVLLLSAIALILFILAIVDSQSASFKDLQQLEGVFYSWTHFLVAGFVLFTFALFDFAIAMFRTLPSQILSPSERLFGLPIVRYSIERKGGEIFVHNVHVVAVLSCFVALDVLGFIVSLGGGSKPWGTALNSAVFCLLSLLGFHLKYARVHGFRNDLSRVNLTSDVAEDAFAHVLKDTVRKIRQFGTRTGIFDSEFVFSMCPRKEGEKLKREEKEKSLAFFFCLFNLALKRKMRMVIQEERLKRRRRRILRAREDDDPDEDDEDDDVEEKVEETEEKQEDGEAKTQWPPTEHHGKPQEEEVKQPRLMHHAESGLSSQVHNAEQSISTNASPSSSLSGDSPIKPEANLFVDDQFVPIPSNVLTDWDDAAVDGIEFDRNELFLWLRPSEISPNRAWGLRIGIEDDETSPTRPDPRQVQQGAIADCWLLSALSVVALKQQLFDRVLLAKHRVPTGKYVVRLFDFVLGDWIDVIIDDCLPCDPDTRLPLFASSRSGNVFWISLVEKAFAKRLGGWPNLNEGQVHRALVDLTGGFSQLFSFEEDFELVESGALWASILSMTLAGQLLVLGSTSKADEFGLVKEHAYAVLSVVEVHDSRGRHRLMQLQDPWGRTDWKGKWSNSDTLRWTPRAKWTVHSQSELTFSSEDDVHQEENSTFWMEFNDVAMLFKWLFACRIFADEQGWIHRDVVADWTSETAGGPPHLAVTMKNPQFLLKFTSPLEETLNQPANTRRRKRFAVVFLSITNLEEKLVYPYMTLLVLHLGGRIVSGPVLSSQVVASTGKYKDARELSLEVALPLDKEFTLLPSLSRPGELGKFRLSCYAKVPFELTRLN